MTMARAVLVVARSSNLSEMLRKELDQLKREAERGRDSCLAVAFCSDCWEEAKERDAAIACTKKESSADREARLQQHERRRWSLLFERELVSSKCSAGWRRQSGENLFSQLRAAWTAHGQRQERHRSLAVRSWWRLWARAGQCGASRAFEKSPLSLVFPTWLRRKGEWLGFHVHHKKRLSRITVARVPPLAICRPN